MGAFLVQNQQKISQNLHKKQNCWENQILSAVLLSEFTSIRPRRAPGPRFFTWL
jgi:hypothetical protein